MIGSTGGRLGGRGNGPGAITNAMGVVSLRIRRSVQFDEGFTPTDRQSMACDILAVKLCLPLLASKRTVGRGRKRRMAECDARIEVSIHLN